MNREQLIDAIVEFITDGMDWKDMLIFVSDVLHEQYEGSSDEELTTLAEEMGIDLEDFK